MKDNTFHLKEKPAVFKNEEEFLSFITSDTYENFTDGTYDWKNDDNGICWAIQISDNIGTEDEKKNGPDIDVKIHLEMRDGRTPAAGKKAGENVTSQQTVCQSALPAYDPFTKSPNGRCGEMYFR